MKTIPRLQSCWHRLATLAVPLLATFHAHSGTFNADFNAGIPAGITLFGSALNYDHSTGGVNNSGVLKLTDATGSQQGGAILDEFDGGAVVGGFTATFDLYIGSGNGADGMSFFFGDFADAAHSEEGPGSIAGLTIAFDVFNNGGPIAEGPAIDLKWNNNILIHRLVGAANATTAAQPIGTATTIRTQTTTGGAAAFVPVRIHVDTDGTLDLTFNNNVVFTNVPVFRPITEATRGPAARFGFGARTGGSFDNHFVDNLKITTVPVAANSVQPTLRSLLPIGLSSPTAGAQGSAVGGVVIEFQDQAASIDPATVTMTYNNTAVTPAVTQRDGVTRITYRGANGALPANQGTVVLTYSTTSTPPIKNTFTYFFPVGPSTQVGAVYTLPTADTSKPGFRIKTHQMEIRRNPGSGAVPSAERQIAGGFINPATGQPYDNIADSSGADPDGYRVEAGLINYNEAAPAAGGGFNANSNPPREDQPVLGIASGTDNYVQSIEGVFFLKAGGHRFGVNSDDGFRLSIGRAPGDVVGVQLGTAGDRGFTDSIVEFLAPQDGYYPFRLMWWETGGGAGCEFFFLDDTGARWLVNDPAAPNPVLVYQTSPAAPPYVSRTLPAVNYAYTFADQDILIDVTDTAFPMTAGSASLTINGAAQTLSESKTGKTTTLKRTGSMANLLPSGANNLVLIYGYSDNGAAKTVTNSWTISVPAYTRPIPPANKVLASQVSGAGFKARGHHLDRSRDANQGNGGRNTGNNMPGPEIQLNNGYIDPANNQPYPNRLDVSGAGPGQTFEVPEVLNFNHNTAAGSGGVASNAGIFNGDTATPGLPGTGSSNQGLDNTVHEFETYIELKAGVHIFGLNVDDGWIASSAPNAKDTLGTLLGFRNGPGGQNGSPANNPNAVFTVIVPEDGIYPFRILFWQGGGGVNLEFLSIDRPTGAQILVNDTAGAYPSIVAGSGQTLSPYRTYSTYTGPVRPWVKFSVHPMPYIGVASPLVNGNAAVTLWQNRNQQVAPGPITLKLPTLNGSWNPGEIQNASTAQRPFGDVVGAVVADLGNASVGMILNGENVTPTITAIPGTTDKLVRYVPPTPLSPTAVHSAGLIYAGTTNFWLFNVISNVVVDPVVAKPSSAADPSSRGFQVKVVQAAAARPGGNTAAAAESQLTGTPANIAVAGPNPDGTFNVPGIINWNVSQNPGGTPNQIGNFQPLMGGPADEPVPGIPGAGLTGAARFENITAEIFAYLDLPAGYQKFGVNGDDGFKVQIGAPGKTDGQVLFSIDRGAGAADLPFAFTTTQPGLYPVRVIWYQGGGGGNVEFFTYSSTGEKIPVNGAHPEAIKAYTKLNVVATPTVAISRAAGGSITLTFTGRLQATDSLVNPAWQNVEGSSPLTLPVNGDRRYYRAIAQ